MHGTLDHLRLIASAVADRSVAVEPVAPGELPWTDGSTVYLDPTASRVEQLRCVSVQASLLAAGSLDAAIVRQLVRRRALAARYLAVEGHRALAWNAEVLPPAVRGLVDQAVAASAASPVVALTLAAGKATVPPTPPSFGEIRVRQVLDEAGRVDAASSPGAPTSDARTTATHLAELDDEDDDGSIGRLLTSPVGGGGAIGKVLGRLLGHTRGRGSGGAPSADAPTHVGRRGDPGGPGARPGWQAAASLHVEEGPVEPAERGMATYAEWDVHQGRYRAHWCRVVEVPPPPDAGVAIPLDDAPALRRSLARLGAGLDRVRRQVDGDDVDIDAAVEARVAALAGLPPDEAVYVQSLRRRRDLAVLVLLDVSGSAGHPGTGGRTVHEHQRRAAASLLVALDDLGDRVGLCAFNSRGRQAVQVTSIKDLDRGLDAAALDRLGALVPAAYTRLGAAIRHGAAVLEERGGTPRRLLVVISDGVAYDHGYEGRYGEADARRALTEARRRGTGCLCLTVGAGVEVDALRRVFGTAAHATVARADQLPPIVAPLFQAALRSAELQQRTHRRRERTRGRLDVDGGRT